MTKKHKHHQGRDHGTHKAKSQGMDESDRSSVFLMPDHAARRAVSLGFLLDFTEENECWSMPTGEVMHRFVAPATNVSSERSVPVRYTELLPEHQVGDVTVFISHTWGNPWGLIVAAARKFASDWKERHPDMQLFYWVDIFAINQHEPDQRIHDIQQLDSVVDAATTVLMVLDEQCLPLGRVWCLFEIMITLAHGKFGKLQMRCGRLDDANQFVPMTDGDQLRAITEEVDMEKAQASVENDRVMIFEQVKKLFPKQGFDDVNRKVRRAVRKGW